MAKKTSHFPSTSLNVFLKGNFDGDDKNSKGRCDVTMNQKQNKCKYCKDLDELVREYPLEPQHGASLYCEECEAEYWEEHSGKIWACNKQAEFNHQKLSKL